MPIQLPNDAVPTGYRKTSPFQFEQVFYSESANFTGTELEFVYAGHGYTYQQLDLHSRIVLPL